MLFLYKDSVFFYPSLQGCWGKGVGVGSQDVIEANLHCFAAILGTVIYVPKFRSYEIHVVI